MVPNLQNFCYLKLIEFLKNFFSLPVAMERAITFLEKRELPPHWDRDILNSHEEESTNNSTTASSESEELEDDDEEDESPEDKDHLVAELYKHMEDRGSPIDKTPSIEGKYVEQN